MKPYSALFLLLTISTAVSRAKTAKGSKKTSTIEALREYMDSLGDQDIGGDFPVFTDTITDDVGLAHTAPLKVKPATSEPCSDKCNKWADPVCYLNRPRLHFSGRFRADIPTINNLRRNYDAAKFTPIKRTIMDFENARFNPKGSGAFSFRDVTVKSVCYTDEADGCITDPEQDEVIGETLDSALHKASAKMVDLDVEAQFLPALYGLRIGVGAYYKTPAFVGSFRPAGFKNLWGSLANSDSDSVMTSSYQSVLDNLIWSDDLGDSKFLKELKARSPELLSIKMNVHSYHPDDESSYHTFGRVEGTIGPASADEPENFVRGRLLRSVESTSKWSSDLETNLAAFVVDRSRRVLTMDIGNALKRNDTNGHENFNLRLLGDSLCLRTDTNVDVATIDLTKPEDILITSGVIEIPLGDKLDAVNQNFLQLQRCDSGDQLMYEMKSVVRPMTRFTRRLNPGEQLPMEFFANERGRTKCNYQISIKIRIKSQQTDKYATPEQIKRAEKALTINGEQEIEVYTKCNGRATVTFDTADPGNPRAFLDGEIYMVKYCHTKSDEPTSVASRLWIVVYQSFTYESPPKWFGENGVRALLQPYSNMYPAMDDILPLGDYFSVTEPRNLIRMKRVLSVDENDPTYMPMTRDLSNGKKQMLLEWLDNPRRGIQGPLDLPGFCRALQTAIQVEHATVPLYLYAMFSIKSGANNELRHVLKTVVIQEMLHITFVANILNAIDADSDVCPPPDLLRDDFIPVYPNALPGGLHPRLTLRLSRVSLGLVKDVFMELEKPAMGLDEEDDEIHHNTIGAFYRRLKRSLVKLHRTGEIKFREDMSNQVYYEYPGIGVVYKIGNLSTALRALKEIEEQGEGSDQSNPVDSSGQLSHYYRFAEVVEGRRLVQSENGSWSYSGNALPFDPDGVWPLPDNPRVRHYAEGSRAHLLASGFSRTYLDLITQLQHTFSGHPDEVEASLSTMLALKMKAKEMVQDKIDDHSSLHVGPPFENPRDLFNMYS